MGNILEKLFGKDNMQVLFASGHDYGQFTRNEGTRIYSPKNLSEAHDRRRIISE